MCSSDLDRQFDSPILWPMRNFQGVQCPNLAPIYWCQICMVLNCIGWKQEVVVHDLCLQLPHAGEDTMPTLQWNPGDWCTLQPFAIELQYMLGLCELWLWHNNKDARHEKRNFAGTILSECHGLIQFPCKHQENGNQCSYIFGLTMLGLLLNSEVVLDCTSMWPPEVTMNSAQFFRDIQRGRLDRKFQYSPWNLNVHNRRIRQVQQELFQCYYFCSLIHLTNQLQYKQWDPGENTENGKMLMATNLHDRGYEFYSNQQSKLQSIICTLGRPWDPGIVAFREWQVQGDISAEVGAAAAICDRIDRAIAWGQAMFLGGGTVTTAHVHIGPCRLGPALPGGNGCISVYRGNKLQRKRHRETEQNRPKSASLFPVPIRLVPSLVFLRSGGYHKPQYPSAHAAIPSPATGVTVE